MFRDIRKNKFFNRRTFFVGGAQAGLSAILVARLGYLQIIKHEEYSIQSDSNSIKPIIRPAGRGIVFDRNGKPLTENKDNYSLYLYLEDKKDIDKLVENLASTLDLDEIAQKQFYEKITKAKRRSMISLLSNISWDDVARLEANSYKLPGTSIESGVIRSYPYAYETAHCVGYVSLPNEKEINDNEKNLFMHPAFRLGKSGLERSFDDHLRGKYGVKYVEVNAFERPIRTISTRDAVIGSDLRLTIDLELQKLATKLMQEKSGSIVLMDVKSGEILTYVSSPSFDPNNFVEGISQEYWGQLNQDPRKPLSNKPISAIYPPGSTFKLMVALAALENGFNPASRFSCPGYFQYGKRRFHCWEEKGHGAMDMLNGIKHSCNVYFFNVANQIGFEKIAEVAKRFGYGEKFDISMYGSRSGTVPNEEWKKRVFKQPWVGGDTLNAAIGQGFVLSTPLQMAVIASRMANGGIPIKPYLIKNHNTQKQFEELRNYKLIKNDNHLNLVLEGMNKVVNEPGGTAYYRRIIEAGFEMAGKTGTSQVISKRESEMTRAEIAMNANQNHAIFVGFAPVSNPKFAVSVVVEHGKSGSGAAAPIAHDLLLEAQRIYKEKEIFL